MSPRDPPAPALVTDTHLAFYVSTGDLNSGSLARMASTLATKPPPYLLGAHFMWYNNYTDVRHGGEYASGR